MWVFDTSKDDLGTVLKDYQEIALGVLWKRGKEGAISREVWAQVNKILIEKEGSISRASIINFLNDMVDKDVLNYEERTGKGGYHRIYFPAFDEDGFKRSIIDKVISKLLKIWPEEARAILVEKLS